MKIKSTLIMLVAVVVAGLIAYNLSKKPTTEEQQERRKKVFPGLTQDDARSLKITARDTTIAVERIEPGKDSWRIIEPLDLRADRWKVQSMLRSFENAEKTATVFPEKGKQVKLGKKGLKNPRRKVSVSGAGGQQWTLLIGNETSIGNAVWAKLARGDMVFTIEKSVADKSNITLNDMRSKKLAAKIQESNLAAVKIKASAYDDQPTFQAKCVRENDRWVLQEPLKDLADGNEISGLAKNINNYHLVKDDFVADGPENLGEYGLDKPLLSLTFEGKDQPTTLAFGVVEQDGEKEYYATNQAEPAIVSIDKSLIDKLRKTPRELRERSLLTYDRSKVQKIMVVGADESFALEKEKNDAWKIAGDSPADADTKVLQNLLGGLKRARVEDFVADSPEDLSRYGLSTENRRTIRLVGKDEKRLAEIYVGKQSDGTLYAQRPGFAPVLSFPAEEYIQNLLTGRLALLNRMVLQEPETRALKVDLSYDDRNFVCERKSANSPWRLLEPVETDVDTATLDEILFDFEKLQAKTFAAESPTDLAKFGLAEPAVSISVTYAPEEESGDEQKKASGDSQRAPYTRTLMIGERSEGQPAGYYATLQSSDRVFVVQDSVVKNLRVNLASRIVSAAKELRELKFVYDGKSRTFEYDSENKKWTGSNGQELPHDLAAKVKKAATLLSNFRADRIVNFVLKSRAQYGFDNPYLTVEIAEETTTGKKVVVGKSAPDGGRFVTGPATGFVLAADDQDVATLMAPAQKAPKPTPSTNEKKPVGVNTGK